MSDPNDDLFVKESPPPYIGEEIDLFLLKDSLAKTPWERMLANDDALNFAESLRAAMKKAKCKTSAS